MMKNVGAVPRNLGQMTYSFKYRESAAGPELETWDPSSAAAGTSCQNLLQDIARLKALATAAADTVLNSSNEPNRLSMGYSEAMNTGKITATLDPETQKVADLMVESRLGPNRQTWTVKGNTLTHTVANASSDNNGSHTITLKPELGTLEYQVQAKYPQ